MNNDDMNNRQAMVLNIQQIGFTLLELNLYLDTHPMDRMALSTYNTLQRQYQDMIAAYNTRYGPLFNFGLAPGGAEEFHWVKSPWPWQQSANVPSYGRG